MFRRSRKNTGSIAKDRLRILVNAERIDCSPRILLMMKKDLVKTVSKYIVVEEEGISLSYHASPPTLKATIPIYQTTRKEQE